jgi:peptidoglycan-N-acetylglucosamine deacetylase
VIFLTVLPVPATGVSFGTLTTLTADPGEYALVRRRLAALAVLSGSLLLAGTAANQPASAGLPARPRPVLALPAAGQRGGSGRGPGGSGPTGTGTPAASASGPGRVPGTGAAGGGSGTDGSGTDGPGTGSPAHGGAGGTPGGTSPPAGPGGIIRGTGSAAVALTFDDGPGAYTPQILALLRQYHVHATFCLIGVNVAANPGLVQAIVRDGHTLCNHTWRHDLNLGSRTPAAIRADLQRTNDAIHRAVPGVPIRYFRNPGGLFTPGTVAAARELGMASLGWNGDPSDWNVKAYPPGPTMTGHIVAYVRAVMRPGMVLLSHDGGGDRSGTVAAYRILLPELLARYELVALPT